jgi:hypothetical protein
MLLLKAKMYTKKCLLITYVRSPDESRRGAKHFTFYIRVHPSAIPIKIQKLPSRSIPWPSPSYNVAWPLPLPTANPKTPTPIHRQSPSNLPLPRRPPLRPQHLDPPATGRSPQNPCPAVPLFDPPPSPPLHSLLSTPDRLALARNPAIRAPDGLWFRTLLLELEYVEARRSAETAGCL